MKSCSLIAALAALTLTSCKSTTGSTTSSEIGASVSLERFEIKPRKRHPKRLENSSGWYRTGDEHLQLHSSYSGFDKQNGKRVSKLHIADEAIDMIQQAQKTILVSAFLFDSMYSQTETFRPIVKEFANLLIQKKENNPNLVIAVVLDPINRSYVDRLPPQIKRLEKNGIDIFYTDLATTNVGIGQKPIQQLHQKRKIFTSLSQHQAQILKKSLEQSTDALPPEIAEGIDQFDGNLNEPLIDPSQKTLDGETITGEMLFNAALVNANHRKLMVTDYGNTYKAIVSSANPHDASLPSTNFAISIVGGLAKYIYNATRLDIKDSIEIADKRSIWKASKSLGKRLEKRWVRWATKRDYLSRSQFKRMGYAYLQDELVKLSSRGKKLETNYNDSYSVNEPEYESELPQQLVNPGVYASFTTESKIKDQIIQALDHASTSAAIRIQMFYLSQPEVRDAIVRASQRVSTPIKLLLDPNKDAFNSQKKGTPNREVAFMLENFKKKNSNLKLEIRWFQTHGEQNHAKIMTIDDPSIDFHYITTGSCNWTSKNMNGGNMEANLSVIGSKKLNAEFNKLFDMFWANNGSDGLIYSDSYDKGPFSTGVTEEEIHKMETMERSGFSGW